MNRGKFKHLIIVQRPDYEHETVDEYGRRSTPWVEHAQRRAQVADVSGRDFYEAAAHQLQDTVTFTVPWVPNLTRNMRILWGGDVYEIDQVNHLGYRRDFMRIKAHTTASEGAQDSGQL